MFGGIPSSISYSMPSAADLPENVADWNVDPSRALLLIHDMQDYFLRPLAAGVSPYTELVENIAFLRSACARAGVPVAYTAQPGGMSPDQRGLLQDMWGPGMSVDESDRGIVARLAPRAADRVFTKWRYSAFHKSDLSRHLAEHGRDQLIVTGVYAHVGVLVTACEAYSRDIETFVAADAVADFSAADHRMMLDYAAARCAVVRTTAELVAPIVVDYARADV